MLYQNIQKKFACEKSFNDFSNLFGFIQHFHATSHLHRLNKHQFKKFILFIFHFIYDENTAVYKYVWDKIAVGNWCRWATRWRPARTTPCASSSPRPRSCSAPTTTWSTPSSGPSSRSTWGTRCVRRNGREGERQICGGFISRDFLRIFFRENFEDFFFFVLRGVLKVASRWEVDLKNG